MLFYLYRIPVRRRPCPCNRNIMDLASLALLATIAPLFLVLRIAAPSLELSSEQYE